MHSEGEQVTIGTTEIGSGTGSGTAASRGMGLEHSASVVGFRAPLAPGRSDLSHLDAMRRTVVPQVDSSGSRSRATSADKRGAIQRALEHDAVLGAAFRYAEVDATGPTKNKEIKEKDDKDRDEEEALVMSLPNEIPLPLGPPPV